MVLSNFFRNFDSLIGLEINFMIKTQKIAANPEKRFPKKSI